MSFKRTLYRIGISIFKFLPLKKYICLILRNLKFFTKKKLHVDLKFKGLFEVEIPNTNLSFNLNAYESTIENEIFWNGLGTSWEPETVNLWIKLCEKANVIFDVGANTGIYSLIAKKINPDAKIVAFEPSTLIIPKLKKNIKDNAISIDLITKGVSNKNGENVFYDVEGHHQSSASLSDQKLKYFSGFKGKIKEYKIQTIRLDSFIESSGLIPDLLKIDVELHEPEVIEGLGSILDRYKPSIIVEVLTNDIAVRLNNLMKNKNYIFYNLDLNPPQRIEKITPVSCYNYYLTTTEL